MAEVATASTRARRARTGCSHVAGHRTCTRSGHAWMTLRRHARRSWPCRVDRVGRCGPLPSGARCRRGHHGRAGRDPRSLARDGPARLLLLLAVLVLNLDKPPAQWSCARPYAPPCAPLVVGLDHPVVRRNLVPGGLRAPGRSGHDVTKRRGERGLLADRHHQSLVLGQVLAEAVAELVSRDPQITVGDDVREALCGQLLADLPRALVGTEGQRSDADEADDIRQVAGLGDSRATVGMSGPPAAWVHPPAGPSCGCAQRRRPARSADSPPPAACRRHGSSARGWSSPSGHPTPAAMDHNNSGIFRHRGAPSTERPEIQVVGSYDCRVTQRDQPTADQGWEPGVSARR